MRPSAIKHQVIVFIFVHILISRDSRIEWYKGAFCAELASYYPGNPQELQLIGLLNLVLHSQELISSFSVRGEDLVVL